MNISPTIILDVEGVLFKTRISTLRSVPGNYFDEFFKRDWRKELDKDGHFFIDRDATTFPLILNFLRDGVSTPLPNDDFMLQRLAQEARFFRLQQLCDILERRTSYGDLSFKSKDKKSPPLKILKESKMKKEDKDKDKKLKTFKHTYEGRSLPPTPVESLPILSDYDRRMSINSPPIPLRKSAVEKHKRKNSIDSISLPRNFTHVAHVGWNGSGIIFEQRLANEDNAVHAIIRAAGETDLNPVYNVVNGEDEQYGSNSVEVFLTGPLMKTKEQLKSKMDFYSSPQKRPLPPPKPIMRPPPRPASANK